MLDTREITREAVVPIHVRNGRFSRKIESGYNDQETLLLYGRTKTGTTKAGATKKAWQTHEATQAISTHQDSFTPQTEW